MIGKGIFRSGRFLILSTIIMLALTLVISPSQQVYSAEEEVNPNERIFAGEDRYETAKLIAEEEFETSREVIIARVDWLDPISANPADALSASMLAGTLEVPILFTNSQYLPDFTKEALENLETEKAYVLGGEEAVEPEVFEEILALTGEAERIYGETRIETGAKIAQRTAEVENDNIADYAFIVHWNGFGNALAAGPAAYEGRAPILLTSSRDEEGIPEATAEVLEELNIQKVYIVGGTDQVTWAQEERLEQMVPHVERLEESTRQIDIARGHPGNSVVVAREFYPEPEEIMLAADNVVDALGGAVLSRPILYVEEGEKELPLAVSNYLEEVEKTATRLIILGGPQAVTEEAEKKAKDTIQATEVRNQKELFEALAREEPHIGFIDNITVTSDPLEINYSTTLNLNNYNLSLDTQDMIITGEEVRVKEGEINSIEEEEIFIRSYKTQLIDIELKTHLVDKEAENFAIRDSKFHDPYKENYEFVSDITIENCDFKDGLEWLQFHHDDATIKNSRFGSHVILNIYGDINLENIEFRGDTDFSVLEVINGAEPVLRGATAKGEHVDFRIEEDSTLQIEEDILVEEELSLLGKGLLSGKGTFTGTGKVCFSQHAQPNELTVRGPTFDVKVNICHGVTTLEKAVLEQDLTVENNGKLILVEEIDNREDTTLWLENQAEIDILEEALLTRDIREYVITQISSREEEVILTTDFGEFTGWHFGDPHFLPDAWTVDKWIQLEEDIEYGTIEIEIEGEYYSTEAGDHDFEEGVYLSQMIEPDPLPLQDQSGRGELEVILRPAELTPMEEGFFRERHVRIEVRAFNAADDYQILLGEDEKIID